MKVKDFTTRPVWADDKWLQRHAGETLNVEKDEDRENENGEGGKEGEEDKEKAASAAKVCSFNVTINYLNFRMWVIITLFFVFGPRRWLLQDRMSGYQRILRSTWTSKLGRQPLEECRLFFAWISHQSPQKTLDVYVLTRKGLVIKVRYSTELFQDL